MTELDAEEGVFRLEPLQDLGTRLEPFAKRLAGTRLVEALDELWPEADAGDGA